MHYNAPHWPWLTREDEAESKRIAQVSSKLYHFDGGSVATYLTMIRQMDEGIGRILLALKEKKLESHTIVVFTSDNGGERYSATWPLVGKKMDLLEGGIRVPHRALAGESEGGRRSPRTAGGHHGLGRDFFSMQQA